MHDENPQTTNMSNLHVPFVAKNAVHVPKSTQPYGKLPKGKELVLKHTKQPKC